MFFIKVPVFFQFFLTFFWLKPCPEIHYIRAVELRSYWKVFLFHMNRSHEMRQPGDFFGEFYPGIKPAL